MSICNISKASYLLYLYLLTHLYSLVDPSSCLLENCWYVFLLYILQSHYHHDLYLSSYLTQEDRRREKPFLAWIGYRTSFFSALFHFFCMHACSIFCYNQPRSEISKFQSSFSLLLILLGLTKWSHPQCTVLYCNVITLSVLYCIVMYSPSVYCTVL